MSAPLQPFEFYDDTYGRHRPGEGMWEAAMLRASLGYDAGGGDDPCFAWAWIDSQGITHLSVDGPPKPPWVEREWIAEYQSVPQRWILPAFTHPEPDEPCGYVPTAEGYSESLGLPMQFHGH